MSDETVPPVVSVILPTYNRLQHLRLAVDSVSAQTFTDWELIIADDGSGSQTREYLASLHCPPRIRVLWREHSGIPAVVRNAALREATGRYVAFLDSDDAWMSRKLEMQVEALRAHPHCRWSYCAFTQVDAQGAVLAEESRRKWAPHEGPIFEKILRNQAAFRSPSVVLAERQLVIQVGGFDERLRSAEDFDLYVRLALHSEIALVNKPLVCVRVHEDNYSSSDVPSGLAGRDYALRKLQASAPEQWRTLLREQRVDTALGLASTYATMHSPANVLRTILSSVSYAWPYTRWWWRVSRAMARSLAPKRLLELWQGLRGGVATSGAAVRGRPE